MVRTTSAEVVPAGSDDGANEQFARAGRPAEQVNVVLDAVTGLGAKAMCVVPDCPALTVMAVKVAGTVKSGVAIVRLADAVLPVPPSAELT